MKFTQLLLLILCFFVQTFAQEYSNFTLRGEPGPILNSGKLYVKFDDFDVYALYQCQACYTYKLTEDQKKTPFWRYSYSSFIELQGNGDECCYQSYGDCPAGPNDCNQHALTLLPPDLVLNSQNLPSLLSVQFEGVLNSALTSGCVPPGNVQNSCANFVFTHELLTEDTIVTVATGTDISVVGNSLRSTVRMATWPFKSGARGMRIKYVFGVGNTALEAVRLFPANTPATTPWADGTFNEVGFETRERMSKIRFSGVARLDGDPTPVKVNVSGPYDHEFDFYAKYFYVDVPTFAQSMEYDTFTRVLFDDLTASATTNGPITIFIVLVLIIINLFM